MKYLIRENIYIHKVRVSITPGSVPDLDVSEPWSRRPEVIRPDTVLIVIESSQEGEGGRGGWGARTVEMTVLGLCVLRGGQVSTRGRTGSRRYVSDRGMDVMARLLDEAPAQVREVLDAVL